MTRPWRTHPAQSCLLPWSRHPGSLWAFCPQRAVLCMALVCLSRESAAAARRSPPHTRPVPPPTGRLSQPAAWNLQMCQARPTLSSLASFIYCAYERNRPRCVTLAESSPRAWRACRERKRMAALRTRALLGPGHGPSPPAYAPATLPQVQQHPGQLAQGPEARHLQARRRQRGAGQRRQAEAPLPAGRSDERCRPRSGAVVGVGPQVP